MNSKEKPKKKKRKSNFLYYFTKITAAIPVLIWLRPKIIYKGQNGKVKRPNVNGAIICSNHEGFTDPIMIICAFWKKILSFLATTDLYDTKLKSFFFSAMHCIPVDKQNFNIASMHAVMDDLKSGGTIVIFPEGRVKSEGEDELCDFKGGAPLIAFLANAPIVPMYIAPKQKWFKRRVAVIGEPIPIREICSGPSMQAVEVAGEKIREKVLELKEIYQKQKGEKL